MPKWACVPGNIMGLLFWHTYSFLRNKTDYQIDEILYLQHNGCLLPDVGIV